MIRYTFKLGISRGKVKKLVKKLGVYKPTCFTVKNKKQIITISFNSEYLISNELQIKLKNYLNPEKKRNTLKRIKPKINYDESIFDSEFELIFKEN